MTNAADDTLMDEPLSDEMLMAYVDGELAEDERRAVEAALARTPALMQRIESFLFTRGPLARPFDAVLAAPIPERLTAFLVDASPVVRRAAASSGPSKLSQIVAGFWAPFLSPAAAIPVVLVSAAAGWLVQQTREADLVWLDDRGSFVASAPLQAALETTPTGMRSAVAPQLALEPTFTFAASGKGWCREYELSHRDGQLAAGVACRDQGTWKVIAQSPTAARRASPDKTVPATASTSVIEEVRNAMKEGDVIVGAQEERLIRERWPTTGPRSQ